MKKFFKKKWVKRIIILLVIIAAAVCGIMFFKGNKTQETAEDVMQTGIVSRRDIVNTVTGSGTVEAYETYKIVPTVLGEIVSCDVEEGEWVEEDQVLYKFDTETRDNAISKAQNAVENAALSLEQVRESVNDLVVKSPVKGVVDGLNLSVGDDAGGIICSVTDNTYMEAFVPVNNAYAKNVKVGDPVTLGLEKYMTEAQGYVTRKSTGSTAAENGGLTTLIEVRLNNPGGIMPGSMVSAVIHTSAGEAEGVEAVALNYPDSAKVNIKTSGTIKTLNIKNGDWVDEGSIIAVLENKQLKNQLKSAEMNYSDAVANLNDTKKDAENYILKAPIAGKVMEKNYKKGDTVAGQNSTTLMVLADMSKMKFTMNIDELDVAKVSLGQEVTLTADAIEGKTFTGVIETVSLLGVSQNGVTTYPIQVRIDDPGDLLPGMNVNAEIIIESAANVLAVPAGAVSYYDGEYYVTVVGEAEMGGNDNGGRESGRENAEDATGGAAEDEGFKPEFDGSEKKMPEGAMPMGKVADGKNKGEKPEQKQNMYSEPLRVKVTTGVSDDDYTEILTGDLKEGMIVQVTSSVNEDWGFGFGGMGGGPMRRMG